MPKKKKSKFRISSYAGNEGNCICPPSDDVYINPLFNEKLVFTFKDMADKAISNISCTQGKFVLTLLKDLSHKTWNDIFENQSELDYHTVELASPDMKRVSQTDLQHIKDVVPDNKKNIERIGLRSDTQNRRIIFERQNDANVITIYHVAKNHYD
jgi:hypothetical protein